MYSPYSTVANGESFGCFDEAGTALAKLPTKVKKNEEVHPFEHPGFALWSRAQWQGADFATDARNSAGSKLRAAITAFAPFSRPRGVIPKQRGILMAVRKSTVDAAMATIKMVRATGCMLKAELWYRRGEVREAVLQQLKTLDVQPMMFEYYVEPTQLGHVCWNAEHLLHQLKPLAIIHSRFEEVLYMDTSVVPIRSLEDLFDSFQFKSTGALFWSDMWMISSNPIWSVLGEGKSDIWEHDASVMLIDKRKSWLALHTAAYMYKELFMKMVNGDKGILQFAWRASKTDFYMMEISPKLVGMMDPASGKVCSHSVMQYGIDREPLFVRLSRSIGMGLRSQLQFTHSIRATKGNKDRVRTVVSDIRLFSDSRDSVLCYKLEVINKVAGDTTTRIVSEALVGMEDFQRQFDKVNAQTRRYFASLPELGGVDMNVDSMLQ